MKRGHGHLTWRQLFSTTQLLSIIQFSFLSVEKVIDPSSTFILVYRGAARNNWMNGKDWVDANIYIVKTLWMKLKRSMDQRSTCALRDSKIQVLQRPHCSLFEFKKKVFLWKIYFYCGFVIFKSIQCASFLLTAITSACNYDLSGSWMMFSLKTK